ncbi:MAG: hypothetical protein HY454_00780 [Parcubacteria group bacterium]|nr:hypothetical protein [Parcubacteria group bacterium]
MPVIMVYGVPDDVGQDTFERYCFRLTSVLVEIRELHLTPDNVSVFFPPDRMKTGLGEEVVIFVEGLFFVPERTFEVKSRLARWLVGATRDLFPNIKTVECFVRTFRQEEDASYSYNEK